MDALSEHADRFDFDAELASLIEADDAIKAGEGRRRDYGAWRIVVAGGSTGVGLGGVGISIALAVARAFQ